MPTDVTANLCSYPSGPEAGLQAYRRTFRSLALNVDDVKTHVHIIGSGTLTGMDACVAVQCAKAGLGVEVTMSPYNQLENEVFSHNLSKQDESKANDLEVVILAWDIEWLLGDSLRNPYKRDGDSFSTRFTARKQLVHSLISHLLMRPNTLIIAHDFVIPLTSPLDLLEHKHEGGLIESITSLNCELRNLAREHSQLWISRIDALASAIGKLRWTDANLRLLGDVRIHPDHLPWVAQESTRIILARRGIVRKCLVLDADNTLWGGILGEDGPNGIQIGPSGSGQPFWEFQQVIAGLWERGVILAICSRNEHKDIIDILDTHPGMVLRSKHFATIEAGWNDKESGLVTIAQRLNIGLDSLVFLDDDPANRLRVRGVLPSVLVPELPTNAGEYANFLARSESFATLHLTTEDLQKGRQYAAQEQREQYRNGVGSISDYLEGLQTVIRVFPLESNNIVRAAQLCQKTNQFNTTTHRFDEEQLKDLRSKGFSITIFGISDRFGDNGLTGITIYQVKDNALLITLFLLSCRVLGRLVEHAIFSYLADKARSAKANSIIIEFIPSDKNKPAANFLNEISRNQQNYLPENGHYSIALDDMPSKPSHITLEE